MVLSSGGAGVSLIVGLPQSFPGDVGVDLGGGEGRVSEEGLHAAQVRPGIEEVGGKRVAELMRSDVEGDVRMGEVFLEQAVDRAGGEALTKLGDEQGSLRDLGGLAVGLDSLHGVRSNRDQALL